jgi:hypothetical protein
VSDLLAQALSQYEAARAAPRPFRWISRRMDNRVDLADKHAVQDVLYRDRRAPPTARKR